MPTDQNQQITYIGSFLFIAGCFLPLANIPVVGDITYYGVDNFSAIIVAFFALAGPVLIHLKKEKFTAISALGVWLTLLWPGIKSMFESEGGTLSKLVSKASDPLADFAADMFMKIDNFSWGGYIFLIGLIALTYGAIRVTLDNR